MKNTAAVAAELEILTAAMDEPGRDVADSLRQLEVTAAAAITAYLGLSVHVTRADPPFAVTVLADGVLPGDIRASLRLVLASPADDRDRLAVTVLLYAGSPGAFVDLAADLAWLTGRPPSEFALDQHLSIPTPCAPATSLRAASFINQGVGVLIARGYTPQRANWQLDLQAAHAGTDRHTAARHILATLTAADSEGVRNNLGSP